MAEDLAAQTESSGSLLRVGQKIGNYRVVRMLGQGGMGAVFEAVHDYIGRQAAIKVLHSDLSKNPQFANRFLNEARAVNLIKHPSLVEIFEHCHPRRHPRRIPSAPRPCARTDPAPARIDSAARRPLRDVRPRSLQTPPGSRHAPGFPVVAARSAC